MKNLIEFPHSHRVFEITVAVTLVIILLLSIDMRQLLSLFSPELAYPKAQYGEFPVKAAGFFGSAMSLPGWHLQLRGGLLYSGVVAILLTPLMLFVRLDRATIFLASNAIFAFLICLSPYLFDWMQDILNYNSVFRVGVLIFHPLILALLLHQLYSHLLGNRTNA
jgi:hypothetical protein